MKSKKFLNYFLIFVVLLGTVFGGMNFQATTAENSTQNGVTEVQPEKETTVNEDSQEDTNASEESSQEDFIGTPAEDGQNSGSVDAASDLSVTFGGIAFSSGGAASELDQSLEVPSGSEVLARTVFGVSANGTVRPGELIFRLEIPADANFKAAQSEIYTFKKGGPTSPDEEPIPGPREYVWVSFKTNLEPGDGKSFSFYLTPSKTGVTPDNTVYPVEINAYSTLGMKKVGQTKNNIISRVPAFKWNEINASVSGGTFNSKGSAIVPTIAVEYSATPNYAAKENGIAFAEAIKYQATYEVPYAQDGTTPYLLIKPENLLKANGEQMVEGVDYTVDARQGGFITKFTVMNTITSTDKSKEITPRNFKFQINGSLLNSAKIIADYNLQPNETSGTFTLNEISNSHTIKPAVDVKDIGTTEQTIAQKQKPQVVFTFKNEMETGNETQEQNKFRKDILRIGTTPTSGTSNAQLAAYPNDLITYQLGAGFRNVQKNAMQSLTFTETSGSSYDPTELEPKYVETGKYTIVNSQPTASTTAKLTLTITYNDGTSTKKVVSGADLATSERVEINETDTKKVATIEYKFTDVDAGFTIASAPLLVFNTIKQEDLTKLGAKFTNEAKMDYVYVNQDLGNETIEHTQSSSAYFFYKEINTGVDGKYVSRKNAENLANPGYYPNKEGAVLQFTIEVKNGDKTPWNIKTLEDIYTYNLSLYDGDKVNALDPESAAIAPEKLSDFPGNFILWDPANPSEKYHDQSIFQIADTPAGVETEGKIDITFDGATGLQLLPEQTLKLTYTMSLNDAYKDRATVGNKFVAKDDTGKDKAKGSFYWSPPDVPTHVHERDRNKSWKNVSGGISTANPYPDDLIAFKVDLKSESIVDWDGPIKIVDKYDEFLEPIGGPTNGGLLGVSEDYEFYDKLDKTKELNFGIAKAPAHFDVSQVTMTLDAANNEFVIDLGNNILKPGEEVSFVYTMMIRGDARPGQTLYNNFTAYDGDREITKGRTMLTIDKFSGKAAILDYTQSVYALEDAEGIKPDINDLLDGDHVRLVNTMENFRNRPTDKVHLKNYRETLPDNFKYLPGTSKIKVVTYNGKNEVTNTVTLSEGTDFTADYQFSSDPDAKNNSLYIRLNNPVEVKGREYRADKLTSRTTVVLEYDAEVDVTSTDFPAIDSTNARERRTFKTDALFLETSDKISDEKSGGPITTDTDDIDQDAATHSFISSSANVSVVNNTRIFAQIEKSATENATIDLTTTDATRKYSLDLVNTNIVDWPIETVVDLLPEHETLDTSKPVQYLDKDGTAYDVKYVVDTYTDAEGKTFERITMNGYIDATGTQQSFLVGKRGRGENNVKHHLIYSTVVDVETALDEMKKADIATLTTTNRAAFYMDPALSFTSSNSKVNDGAGTENWDGNDATEFRYQTTRNVAIKASYISPFVNIKPQKITVQGTGAPETYEDYVHGVTTVNPGDIIAWQLNYGNSNQEKTVDIEEGTPLMVMLPPGLSYEGYKRDANGDEVVPAYLSEPTFKTVNNSTVIVWKTTEKLAKGTDISFGIRTTTGRSYATHYAQAYLVPKKTDLQYFYNSQIAQASEYSKYSYRGETKDITHLLPETAKFTHYVVSQSQLDVYGELGVSSAFKVTDPSGQATPATVASVDPGDRVMNLKDKEDAFRYTMQVNANKSIRDITQPVFINRLPAKGDLTTLGDRNRESEATARILGDGNFSAEVLDANNNAVISTLTKDTDYVVEYFFGDMNATFTTADWNGTPDAGRWLQDAAVDAEGLSTATAVRVRVIDPSFILSEKQIISVSYDAKLKDYKVGNRIAYNTFGYNVKVGTSLDLTSEPLSVGVKAQILKDRARVEKVLLDQNEAPKLQSFEMDLIGKDEAGIEQYRETFTVDANDFVDSDGDGVNDMWTGTTELFMLPFGLDYSVEEPAIADYEAPQYTVEPVEQPDGTTEWVIIVVNEPKYYADVTITTVLLENTDTPSTRSFDVDLVAKDASGKEVSRVPYTINLEKQASSWSGQLFLEKLDVALTYSVEHKSPKNYKHTYAESVEEIPYGKSWDFVLTYERIPDKTLPTTGENNYGYLVGITLLATSAVLVFVRKKYTK